MASVGSCRLGRVAAHVRREERTGSRRGQQAVDRVGDREAPRRRRRASRIHLPGRAHREERARARGEGGEAARHTARARARSGGPGSGSIVTMTSRGGERAVPHYNVMGVAKATLDASVRYLAWDLGQKNIRVNAISAGPVRTLAARSIAGFTTMEDIVEERSPLHRRIEADDVGAAAAFLLSDAASNVTGTTLYVDSGYHAMGM